MSTHITYRNMGNLNLSVIKCTPAINVLFEIGIAQYKFSISRRSSYFNMLLLFNCFSKLTLSTLNRTICKVF